MTKTIQVKANQLSQLCLDGNQCLLTNIMQDIDLLLGNVRGFLNLDYKRHLDSFLDAVRDDTSMRFIKDFDSIFQHRAHVGQKDNVRLVKDMLDMEGLRQIYSTLILNSINKIEEEYSEQLDQMIHQVMQLTITAKVAPSDQTIVNAANNANNDNACNINGFGQNSGLVKPDLPSRSSSLIDENSIKLDGKDGKEGKKGAFSKMLNHLTKSRPKARRSKKIENNMVSVDSINDSTFDSQSIDHLGNERISVDHNLDDAKDLSIENTQNQSNQAFSNSEMTLAMSNLATVMNQSKSVSANAQNKSPVETQSSLKETSQKISADSESLEKEGSPKKLVKNMLDDEIGKPVPAPRKPLVQQIDETIFQTKDSEILQKPKVAPRQVKVGTSPVEDSSDYLSKADKESINTDFILQKISPSDKRNSVKNPIDRPRSEIIGPTNHNAIMDFKRPLSMVEDPISVSDNDVQNSKPESLPEAALKRIPGGISGQHGAIGALAAAVTGRYNINNSSHCTKTSDSSTAQSEVRIGPKPTPPKRPYKNNPTEEANISEHSVESIFIPPTNSPKINTGSKDTVNRPKSEVIGEATISVDVPNRPLSLTDELEIRDTSNAESESQATPRRIPGVFSQHGAIGALAAAVTGRRNNSVSSNAESDTTSSPIRKDTSIMPNSIPVEDNNLEEIPETNDQSAIAHPVRSDSYVSAVPMTFKKKDTSLSGDDKGIEKSALEWLNLNLASKDIHIDNIYNSLGDGLNLIYALENATKNSVGKYNKRTMLPVHKIDNLSVVLNFLAKRGVDVQFITPQDIIDGIKGKILTLFVGILKL